MGVYFRMAHFRFPLPLVLLFDFDCFLNSAVRFEDVHSRVFVELVDEFRKDKRNVIKNVPVGARRRERRAPRRRYR